MVVSGLLVVDIVMAQGIWIRDEFMELSEVIGTTYTIEELGKRLGESDLDILNDLLADNGLSQCIVCGTWVYEVNDDWECPDCEDTD